MSEATDLMQWEEVFTLQLAAAVPTEIGQGPFGHRIVHQIDDGTITGERIQGKLQTACDWSLVGADGYLRIDARGQIETHDGAFLYAQYDGLLELSEALRQAMAEDRATEFEDQDCFINLKIETGDDRYQWVNTSFFVGRGRSLSGGRVEYRVYRPA